MPEANYLVCSVQLPARPHEWNLIATPGEWKGYRGGTRTLTPDDLASAVKYFDEVNAANGNDVLIDYGHATLLAASGKLNPKDADAAGWIHELQIREGVRGAELWARQTWTPAARAKIEAREQRYLSPALFFRVPHPVTGAPVRCVLHSVALTNTPFFKHLPAIAASDLFPHPSERHTRPSAFHGFAAEFLAAKATEISAAGIAAAPLRCTVQDPAAFDRLRQAELAAGIHIHLGQREDDEWHIIGFAFDPARFPPVRARSWLDEHGIAASLTTTTREENDVDPKTLAKLLGLAEDSTEDQITAKITAIVAMANAAPPPVAPEVAELLGVQPDADLAAVTAAIGNRQSEIGDSVDDRVVVLAASLGLDSSATAAELLAAIEAVKGKAVTDEAAALVASAVADRKIAPADRGNWLAMARRNLEGTAALIASLTPILAAGGTAAPPDDGDDPLTPVESRVATEFGVDPKDMATLKAERAARA